MDIKKNISDGVKPEVKDKIIKLCKAIIPDAAIWIYGSRARGDYTERSDIDIALEASQPIDFFAIAELKDILAAANIAYRFDIVDLNAIQDIGFKSAIEKERILWQK